MTVRPCHRALPDALATAEVLLGLIGLAQEQGAGTAEDVMALALAAPRRARQRRHLAAGLPSGPGVYVMRDRLGQALYVGKAGDLRTRVRSYFGARRQPPRIEGALAALAAIDAAPTGSELEAALAELELIRRWRPPGNVRDKRPDRSVYLRLALADHAPALAVREAVRDDGAVYARPFASRRLATEAAEALRDGYRLRTCRPRVPVDDGSCLRGAAGRCLAPCHGGDEALAYVRSARALAAWLAGEEAVLDAPLRARVARLIGQQRYEDAGRATRQLDSLRAADAQIAAIRRAGRRTGVLLAADLDPRLVVAFAVVRGALVAKRRLPRAGDPGLELTAVARELERALAPARRSSREREAPGSRRSATPRRCCSPMPSPAGRGGSWRSRASRPMRWRSGASRRPPTRARARAAAARAAMRAPTISSPSRKLAQGRTPVAARPAPHRSFSGLARPAR